MALAARRDALEAATNALRGLEEQRMRIEQGLEPLRVKIGDLKLKEQAAALNTEQFAQQLLEAGADVNTRDKLGLSPLLVACGKTTQGYRSIAEALIKKGAMINVRDTLGFTPLLLALTGGNLDLAKLLIERGADLTVSTRKGESALSLAEKIQSPEGAEIVDLLKSKLAKPQ